MHATDYAEILTKWEHPSHYGGFSPDGDYLILSVHRESDSVSRSNWECALQTLRAESENSGIECPEDRFRDSVVREDWVYSFRASHPLVGWIDYMLVRKDAPESVLIAAAEIVCALAGYPILNEDHHSDLEWEEICVYWESMSVRERFEAIKYAGGVSIFAARRDEFPQDDSGALFDYLRR